MGVIVTMLGADASRDQMHAEGDYVQRDRSDISLDKLSDNEWRVCDRRVPVHDASSVLGLIEKTAEGYEVLAIEGGPKRSVEGSLDDAVEVFAVPSTR
ncbi:hypothetical protein SAMN04489806_2673 [Paramicrobacterium humi]|uniref:Uncharacterized protein n=1 Tax=Paramicrobacterium humi TaxID=640635 RepID=A0A1H4Q0A5_9MICO|nr:hypothetical protein SAMN04489806_2673 [Microbacterium humi]